VQQNTNTALPIIKNMLSDIIFPFQENELGAFLLSSKKEVSPKANAPGETTSLLKRWTITPLY
jgi:hypothetical protein